MEILSVNLSVIISSPVIGQAEIVKEETKELFEHDESLQTFTKGSKQPDEDATDGTLVFWLNK